MTQRRSESIEVFEFAPFCVRGDFTPSSTADVVVVVDDDDDDDDVVDMVASAWPSAAFAVLNRIIFI
jgi:predicted nucleotidyltransferase